MSDKKNLGSDWDLVEQAEKTQIIDEISKELSRANPELFDGKMKLNESIDYENLRALVSTHVNSRSDLLPHEREEAVQELIGQATGYGVLTEFYLGEDAEKITEINTNVTPDGKIPVFVGIGGNQRYAGDHYFKNSDEVHAFLRKHVADSKQTFSAESPIVDAWMNDGSRINAFGFKVSPYSAVTMSIRKSPTSRPPLPLEFMVENGTFPLLFRDFLVDLLVPGRSNLGFFGGTDTGKTALMRSAGQYIDPGDRTFIGETSFELFMPHLENVVNMLTVKVGTEEIVNMAQICDAMNRSNPKRAIISEIRGGETPSVNEIATSVSGGFWTSGHAGKLNKLKARLPKMYARGGVDLARSLVDDEIRSMFDFMAFLDKDEMGNRTLMELVEVTDDEFKTILLFDREEFALSRGKTKRWIYNQAIEYERLGELAFKGAKSFKKIYEEVPGNGTKKYLYPGMDGEPRAN